MQARNFRRLYVRSYRENELAQWSRIQSWVNGLRT